MLKPSHGKARWDSGRAYVRPRGMDGKRLMIRLADGLSPAAADARAQLVMDIVARLRDAGRMKVAEELALRAAEATDDEALRGVQTAVDAICHGATVTRTKFTGTMTFKQFAQGWTLGDLHREYPQYVRLKKTADQDELLLNKHVYPHIGAVPIAGITLEHAHGVMRRIPPSLSSYTHRHVAQVISRVMRLATYPAQVVDRNPLPAKGFLPLVDRSQAFTYLYPSEDEQLLAFAKIKLVHRLFYGCLAREGMRVSELRSLDWRDLDLERGLVNLDDNKTNDPRAWALDPHVAEALRLWREHFHPSPRPESRIFVRDDGEPLIGAGRADDLREYLKAAGVRRPQLHTNSKHRRWLRIHDLRATFVTVALATGKTETWVADRTGHRSSTMIYKYRRQARAHQELALGGLLPLVVAIPEFKELAVPNPGRGRKSAA